MSARLVCENCGAELPAMLTIDDCGYVRFGYCPPCGFLTAEQHHLSRRSNGASEVPPTGQRVERVIAMTDAAASKVVASLSCG